MKNKEIRIINVADEALERYHELLEENHRLNDVNNKLTSRMELVAMLMEGLGKGFFYHDVMDMCLNSGYLSKCRKYR